jgi:UDP-N-acetylglucosamine 2-epimerase (non-hydrolysing)
MILIAFGTRPEWIKIKPVVEKLNGNIPFRLVCTGQHGSLIDSTIKQYQVDYLSIVDGDNRLDSIVKSILENASNIFDGISYVMVQGDTTSAFSVALAAFHRQVKVIHLEAGLRSWDKDHPYPEEFNRVAIGALADIHLCPTEQTKINLRNVSGHTSKSYVIGNTVLDNLVNIKPTLENLVLITLHRRENIKIMDRWFVAINKLAIDNPSLKFIFPMHPNPEVQRHKHLLTHVDVINPLSYNECIDYVARCCLVITDSGGLQEESSFLKKKCIVCRETTERSEGEYIFSWLCHDPEQLEYLFKSTKRKMVDMPCPYGDGKASDRIKDILESYNVK